MRSRRRSARTCIAIAPGCWLRLRGRGRGAGGARQGRRAYPGADGIAPPKAWLFRIADNAALDAQRRRKRQEARRPEVDLGALVDDTAASDAQVAVEASLAAFMPLSATERSGVILVDLLGDSLNETAEALGVSGR